MRTVYFLENKGFSDFLPCDAGRERCDPCHKFGPNIRNYYLIHFVVSGEGRFINPRGEYRVRAGEAFFIRSGEITTYESDANNPWEYVWVGFKGNLSPCFDSLADVFEYPDDAVSYIEEAVSAEAGREELLAAVIFRLSTALLSERGSGANDYPNKVKSYIDTHYMDNISILDISQTLSLNRKYLARIFKEKVGISMQEYLINKRLHEAKKLLKLGHSVEQAAGMVGYSDQFGFSKAFKKRYGSSPSSYKGNK